MRHQLRTGLMNGLERRARQFELAAGLERNRATTGNVIKADDVAALHDRLPAEQQLHALKQRLDAAVAFVRNGVVATERERRLLVLGADAKLFFWFFTARNPGDELVARLERCRIGLITGHEFSRKAFSA